MKCTDRLPNKNGNRRQKEMTASPSKYPQGYFKDKGCRWCGGVFSPKAPSHLNCSQECADRSVAERAIRRKYGIGLRDYWGLLDKQENKCAICKEEGFTMAEYHWKKLVIDHNHATGAVRGLLCHNCNRGLGLFQDKSSNLENAVKYLNKKA